MICADNMAWECAALARPGRCPLPARVGNRFNLGRFRCGVRVVRSVAGGFECPAMINAPGYSGRSSGGISTSVCAHAQFPAGHAPHAGLLPVGRTAFHAWSTRHGRTPSWHARRRSMVRRWPRRIGSVNMWRCMPGAPVCVAPRDGALLRESRQLPVTLSVRRGDFAHLSANAQGGVT